MGGACITHGEDEKSTFWLESLKGSDNSEEKNIDGRKI
jgi:hypothetical protein